MNERNLIMLTDMLTNARRSTPVESMPRDRLVFLRERLSEAIRDLVELDSRLVDILAALPEAGKA